MTDAPSTKTCLLRIHGIVQGVNYRRWMQGEAQARGICGWTRNRRDGTVEALVHGPDSRIEDLIRACREGPSIARVDKVEAETAEYDGSTDFRVESTV